MAPVTTSLPDVRERSSPFGLGFVPIMDRYLFLEILGPFIFGVGIFSAVSVSIGVVFDLVRKVTESGLPMGIAVQVFLLKMPSFIVLALPMSMLLASLMAFSQLSASSELTALKSCGVSAYRFVVPAIVFSALVTGITFGFQEALVPAANTQSREALEAALESDRPAFQDSNILYQQFESVKRPDGGRDDVLRRMFYAQRYDGKQMYNLTIMDFASGQLNQIVSAKTGFWNEQVRKWDFRNGTIYLVAPDGSYKSTASFEEHQLNIPRTPLDLTRRRRDTTEMTIAEATEYLGIIRQGGNEKRARKLEVRIAQKYAFPFVCMVFGLLGAALGVVPNQRTSRATGFGISVLIIFCYYLLDFISGAMGIQGTLPPFLSAFLPILSGLVVGLFILRRAAR